MARPRPKLQFGTNFAIFAMFFGISLIDAFQSHNWLRVVFWLAVAALFLWADVKAAHVREH